MILKKSFSYLKRQDIVYQYLTVTTVVKGNAESERGNDIDAAYITLVSFLMKELNRCCHSWSLTNHRCRNPSLNLRGVFVVKFAPLDFILLVTSA